MAKIVQCPLFHQELLADINNAFLLTDSDERKKKMLELESDYKSHNWITPALKEELELLFPTAPDIDSNNSNQREFAQDTTTIQIGFNDLQDENVLLI